MRRLLLIILLVALGGCANDDAETAKQQRITSEMTATLTNRPDVEDAKITYQNSLDAAATVSANVQLVAGTDPGPVADEVVRLLWTSPLTPLNGVSVSVWDVTDNTRNDVRVLSFSDAATKTDLETRHGPRPV